MVGGVDQLSGIYVEEMKNVSLVGRHRVNDDLSSKMTLVRATLNAAPANILPPKQALPWRRMTLLDC